MLEAIVFGFLSIAVWCAMQIVYGIGAVLNFAVGVVTGDRRGG